MVKGEAPESTASTGPRRQPFQPYQHVILRSTPCMPQSMKWSMDGQLGVVTDSDLYIITPKTTMQIGSMPYDICTLNIQTALQSPVLPTECDDIIEEEDFDGYVPFKLTQQLRRKEGWRTMCWSPTGCSSIGSCLAAVFMKNGDVTILSPSNDPVKQWQPIYSMKTLFSTLGVPGQGICDPSFTAMDWSDSFGYEEKSLLVLGNARGYIVAFSFTNLIRTDASLVVQPTFTFCHTSQVVASPIKLLKWSPWCSNGMEDVAYLFVASLGGDSYLYECRRVQLPTATASPVTLTKIKTFASQSLCLFTTATWSPEPHDGHHLLAIGQGNHVHVVCVPTSGGSTMDTNQQKTSVKLAGSLSAAHGITWNAKAMSFYVHQLDGHLSLFRCIMGDADAATPFRVRAVPEVTHDLTQGLFNYIDRITSSHQKSATRSGKALLGEEGAGEDDDDDDEDDEGGEEEGLRVLFYGTDSSPSNLFEGLLYRCNAAIKGITKRKKWMEKGRLVLYAPPTPLPGQAGSTEDALYQSYCQILETPSKLKCLPGFMKDVIRWNVFHEISGSDSPTSFLHRFTERLMGLLGTYMGQLDIQLQHYRTGCFSNTNENHADAIRQALFVLHQGIFGASSQCLWVLRSLNVLYSQIAREAMEDATRQEALSALADVEETISVVYCYWLVIFFEVYMAKHHAHAPLPHADLATLLTAWAWSSMTLAPLAPLYPTTFSMSSGIISGHYIPHLLSVLSPSHSPATLLQTLAQNPDKIHETLCRLLTGVHQDERCAVCLERITFESIHSGTCRNNHRWERCQLTFRLLSSVHGTRSSHQCDVHAAINEGEISKANNERAGVQGCSNRSTPPCRMFRHQKPCLTPDDPSDHDGPTLRRDFLVRCQKCLYSGLCMYE